MPISLNSINQEDLNELEKGETILYKGSQIEFIYNKLNLGEGKLYILEKRLIWINENESKKKKVTNFKELATNNIYMNHYEKNKEFYLHLLNDVNNITIDSSNIALHAISSDKKICDRSCVYIQLNTDMSDYFESEKVKDDEDIENTVRVNNINDNEENDSDEDIPYDEIITPEILIICKNETENDAIFRHLSNMDNCLNDDNDIDDDDEYNYEDNYSLNEDEENKGDEKEQ
ncbi:conserved Plasmodium protein, unknown function [Plasmodium gallinaceum]|uniref:Voldacs domain-containing protein n=1 Tax=Plasmodium gallinaceum TaxID=5849 RepID=A0A1J1GRH2_PLAGA|nr:conserved Plasmodium protein, unknown function [Plasmodium gallinaceum]CRG95061.1 conserved Plasmodium protein, unknown function [Plasmodium gallinaceum]